MLQGHEVVLNLWWKNLCVFHNRWVVGGENGFLPCVLPVTNIARIYITNKSVWEWGAHKNNWGCLPVPTCFLCCYLSWVRKYFSNFSYYGAISFRWVLCLNWDETCFEKRVPLLTFPKPWDVFSKIKQLSISIQPESRKCILKKLLGHFICLDIHSSIWDASSPLPSSLYSIIRASHY